jgi:hypothetical protein
VINLQNNRSFNEFSNVDYDGLIDYFATLSGEVYLIISALLALIIARSVSTPSKQNSLGNFFIQLGQSIITITAQDLTRNPNNASLRLNNIEEEIEYIKRRLNL